MVTVRGVIDSVFIVGVSAAPLGMLFRWKARIDPMTLKEAMMAGWFGIPYILGPPMFYIGVPSLIFGGLGILIMWAVTGTPPFGVH